MAQEEIMQIFKLAAAVLLLLLHTVTTAYPSSITPELSGN